MKERERKTEKGKREERETERDTPNASKMSRNNTPLRQQTYLPGDKSSQSAPVLDSRLTPSVG